MKAVPSKQDIQAHTKDSLHVARSVATKRRRRSHVSAALGLAALAWLTPHESRADQFILFDAMFTYTWDDAINSEPSQSHYYVNEDNVLNLERPEDWLSPVDYRNGTVHVRIEVFDKPPGGHEANWTLCYIPNSGGYGCAQTGVYTDVGVHESDVSMTEWWNNDQINWNEGIRQMDLIYKKSTAGLDHVHFFPETETLLMPTTVRITMVQVSAGDTYDPSILGLGEPDAGAAGAAGQGGEGGASGAAGDSSIGTAGMSGAGQGGMAPVIAPPPAGAAGAEVMPIAAAGAGGAAGAPVVARSSESGGCAVTSVVGSSGSLGARWYFLGALGFGVLGFGLRRRGVSRHS